MVFEYGSAAHQNLIHSLLALAGERMPTDHFISIDKIRGNENDKVIWFLANKWMHVAETDEASRHELHDLQSQLIIKSIGPLQNYLTDEEWDLWTDLINDELGNLRTFNEAFLGLLWNRGVLTDETADKLNCVAWYYVTYYIIGSFAYNAIRPRIIDDKSSEAFIDSNRSMTTMHMNLIGTLDRFEMGADDLAFIESGIELVKNFPTEMSWEEYYDQASK